VGCYDTFYQGGASVQIKCFGGKLGHYHVGDRVPPLHFYEDYEMWAEEDQLDTYTVVLSEYAGYKYALFKDRVFVGFTDLHTETYEPYVSKWGIKLDSLDCSEQTITEE
jgi:hypothetical protein